MKQKTRKPLLLLPFLFSVNFSVIAQSGYTIKGHISGVEDGTKVYLHDVDAQVKLDSAVLVKNNFMFTGHVTIPTTCWVECKDQYSIIQVENTEIEFSSPFKDMRLYSITKGGKEQELQNRLTSLQHPYEVIYLGAYDSLTRKLYSGDEHKQRLISDLKNYQDTAQNIYIEFGKKNPNSYLGLDVLYRNRQRIGKEFIETLLQQMDESIRSTAKAQSLFTFVYGELAQTGKPFIDFEVANLDGSPFTLSSLKGQYILLSFWNAGCVPCRRENKKLSADYSRLKEKISLVSFSTDNNRNAWLKASKEDGIKWTNVSDLKGNVGKIKTQYDVQAIPTSYLINKDGIIIEKFVGLDENFIAQLEKLISKGP